MSVEEDTFTRELDIEVIDKTLVFKQKIVGDVNCVVWDAAIVLAKYLEELYKSDEKFFHGKQIVELGAGLGCVGLTVAALGASVVLTDLPETLPLLDLNIKQNKCVIEENGGKATGQELIWGTKPTIAFIPQLIILADCIYYKKSIDALVITLQDLSGPNTEILITQEMRESPIQQENWKYFIKCLEKKFQMTDIPLSEQNQIYSSPDIKLIKCRRK